MTMPERTLTALRGSIAKWEAIVEGDGKDRATRNCPLCQEFFAGDCEGCPVREASGAPYCEGTPYDNWHDEFGHNYRAINDAPEEDQPALRRLAQAELDFLRSLLPEAKPEATPEAQP